MAKISAKNTVRATPKAARKTAAPKRATNPDIFRFIDFFVKTGERMLGKKPTIARGKDGKLVSYALAKFPESKLETLAIWFLSHKQNLQPTIGAMLSTAVLTELTREMDKSSFWKEVAELTDRYYPRTVHAQTWQPFSHQDITDIKERMALLMRRMKY